MTQGSGHPLDGEDEPKSVSVGNIFTEGISMGFADPMQVNTENMQQQIQTNQNLLNNQTQGSVQNPIDANQIMMQNQQMFGGTISGSVNQGFWDYKSEKPKNGEKTNKTKKTRHYRKSRRGFEKQKKNVFYVKMGQ